LERIAEFPSESRAGLTRLFQCRDAIVPLGKWKLCPGFCSFFA
jgi:hypothetical protein